MENLKNYIKDYIDESVWDIEDNIEDDNKEFVLNDIKKFIGDNYYRINITHCEFVFDKKKGKHIVNYDQTVDLKRDIPQLTNGLFEWGTIKGWFSCADCSKLESLKGAPSKVNGNFYCNGCPIISLEGAPEYVGGTFDCDRCKNLTSLEGAPKEVGNDFRCYKCNELTSLEGAPKKVGGVFNCYKCIELKSLEGAPKEVGRDFDCRRCPNLHSLDGVGKVKGGIFSDIE